MKEIKNNRSKKMSVYLKLVAGIAALLMLAFFVMCTIQSVSDNLKDTGSQYFFMLTADPKLNLGFMWFTAVLCFFIVFQFWKISDQIGRENSFSEENAVSFHRMTVSSIIIVIQYIIRIILFIALDKVNIMSLYLRGGMAIAFILFAVLTEALAGLVRNAYEMKQEADLTI